MKKILIFILSDGWRNTLSFILNGIKSFFYNRSHTLCLYLNLKNFNSIKKPDLKKEYYCKVIRSTDEIKRLNFKRLSILPYQKWIDAGGFLCVVFKDDRPAGFGWIHFHRHIIKNVGEFDLGDDIAWLGPFFVHKYFRGNGLQKLLISSCISNLPENIKAVITSVNESNLPSLISFEKLGFDIGAKVITRNGFFSSKSTDIEITDTESRKYFRIK